MLVPATAVLVELYVLLLSGLVNWLLMATFVEKLIDDAGNPLGVSNCTLSLSPSVLACASTALTWPAL